VRGDQCPRYVSRKIHGRRTPHFGRVRRSARVATDGKDDREAIEEAIDALDRSLNPLVRRKRSRASAAKRGQRLVPVPLWLAPNWRSTCDARAASQQLELARRLGVTSE